MTDNYPCTEAEINAPADEEGGPVYISSSESVGCGHEDSMNRMPDPNAEWVTSPATPERVLRNPNTPTSN